MPDDMQPDQYGIGARISLHPMTDRFVEVILGALDDVAGTPSATRITTETSDVSTFVGGDEIDVLTWVRDLVTAATRRADGAHLAVGLLLSRGCPGELACALPQGRPWAPHDVVQLASTGVRASAEWSLYPLDDSGTRAHMEPIEAAIATARESGLYAGSPHYATRLVGDVADILALVGTAWLRVGAQVQHVVTHLNLSINSPTA